MKDQDRFCSLFKAYLKICRKYMERFPEARPLFKKDMDWCEAQPSGRFSFSVRRVKDPKGTASAALMGNKLTSEYQEFTSYLTTHKVIGRRVGGRAFSEVGPTSIKETGFVNDLLKEYLRRNKSFCFNKRITVSLYGAIIAFFSQKQLEAVVWCCLEFVGIEGKQFRINENVLIKSLSPTDIETLYNTNDAFQRFYFGQWTKQNSFKHIKAVLQVRFLSDIYYEGHETKITPYDPRYRGQVIINNALAALRLNTVGDVNSSPVSVRVIQNPFYNYERPFDDNGYRPPNIVGTIGKSVYNRVRRTFYDVNRFRETHPDANLLLNRLWMTTHRSSNEDIIVDSCIAMETLAKTFLAKKKKSGSRLSATELAIYVAHLIGTSSEGRKRVFEIVVDGFSLRNSIVHGSRMRSGAEEALCKFSSVLRHAVSEVLSQSPNISRKTIEDLVL